MSFKVLVLCWVVVSPWSFLGKQLSLHKWLSTWNIQMESRRTNHPQIAHWLFHNDGRWWRAPWWGTGEIRLSGFRVGIRVRWTKKWGSNSSHSTSWKCWTETWDLSLNTRPWQCYSLGLLTMAKRHNSLFVIKIKNSCQTLWKFKTFWGLFAEIKSPWIRTGDGKEPAKEWMRKVESLNWVLNRIYDRLIMERLP